MEKQGVFYAVSVGPGDPELLTRQACRVLEACDVIAAPRMKSGRMLALDIAAGAVDMQGKTVLKPQEKFYLADASLKYCIMGFNPKSVAAMLENIVYFELRRKGYDVYIGKNASKEIDFVAVRRDERIYVQVCRNLPEESDREIANLLEIKDHYPKYVVTLDEVAAGNINGIKIVHLADFLLSQDY